MALRSLSWDLSNFSSSFSCAFFRSLVALSSFLSLLRRRRLRRFAALDGDSDDLEDDVELVAEDDGELERDVVERERDDRELELRRRRRATFLDAALPLAIAVAGDVPAARAAAVVAVAAADALPACSMSLASSLRFFSTALRRS